MRMRQLSPRALALSPRALALRPALIGINNRDLRDFSVDVQRTFALLEHLPADVTVVSESGISDPAQLAELARAGVDGVLVGESLMRAQDPAAALRGLLAGARDGGVDEPRDGLLGDAGDGLLDDPGDSLGSAAGEL